MNHVEVTRRFAADRRRVFQALLDAPGWSRWAGVGPIAFERAGDELGVGAIRVFRLVRTREQILSVEPERRFTYTVLSGVPIRNHHGETAVVDLPAGGCEVTWRCRFESRLPGLGGLIAAIVRFAFRVFLRRLDRHLTG